jgi:hypothetical protein
MAETTDTLAPRLKCDHWFFGPVREDPIDVPAEPKRNAAPV